MLFFFLNSRKDRHEKEKDLKNSTWSALFHFPWHKQIFLQFKYSNIYNEVTILISLQHLHNLLIFKNIGASAILEGQRDARSKIAGCSLYCIQEPTTMQIPFKCLCGKTVLDTEHILKAIYYHFLFKVVIYHSLKILIQDNWMIPL